MKAFLGILVVLVVLAALVLVPAIGAYNGLVSRSQDVDRQWAQVQSQYQRRADLIPNLVNTVSGAANFERTTLTEIVNARSSVGRVTIDPSRAPDDPQQLAAFEQAQGALSNALSRLLVVVERYPELKANANFQALQAQLEGTENRIAVERGRFNDSVREYNVAVRRFPGSLLAGFFNFRERPYFQAAPGSETPPAVQFDFSKPPVVPPTTAPAPSPAPAPAPVNP